MMRSSETFRQLPKSTVLIPAVTLSLLLCSGCMGSLLQMPASLSSKLPKLGKDDAPEIRDKDFDEDDDDFDTRIETPLLSDYISVQGNNLVALRGVGLVTGLDGTGDDPPPSYHRNELREEFTRRGIENPNVWLKDRNTAMVLVTAYLPAMVRDGQTFDVRVMLPPNSEATSLKGGYLVETRLLEEQVAGGRVLKGHEYAVASGAIVTAFGAKNSDNKGALLRRGSIPGGAVSKTERDLEVVLRNDVRSLRNSRRIANAISERFHHYNRYGQRITLAEAKTDAMIALKVHPNYRNNFPRYQQVIRSIAFKETDVARRMRMELLAEQILDPDTAGSAALQLEAVGLDGIPFLKPALESDSAEVRFHAAMALAYQEDSSGVDILQQAAREEPAFRVYALAALSVIKDARAVVALRELLDGDSLETRYGALRALKENEPRDRALGTTEFPGQFVLHEIQSDSAPMVHVTRYRAPEISIFGTGQNLRLPLYLNAGRKLSLMGRAGDQQLMLTKYELDQEPHRVPVSPRLTDVIRAAGELGATYPDIVQLLVEADLQHNLAGEFGIDQLPQAGRALVNYGSQENADDEDTDGDGEDSDKSSSGRRKRVGSAALIPDLFDRVEEDPLYAEAEPASPLDEMLSLQTAEAPADTSAPADPMQPKDDRPAAAISGLSEPDPNSADEQDSFNSADAAETADDWSEDEVDQEDAEYIPRVEKADFQPSLWQRISGPFRKDP